MFPYTCSATRSDKIDHLLLADDRVQRFLKLSVVQKGQITSKSTHWYGIPCLKRSNRRKPISTPHIIPYSLRLFLRVTSTSDRHSCGSSAVAASACGLSRSKVASWTLGCLCFPLRQKNRIHRSKPYGLYRPVRGRPNVWFPRTRSHIIACILSYNCSLIFRAT